MRIPLLPSRLTVVRCFSSSFARPAVASSSSSALPSTVLPPREFLKNLLLEEKVAKRLAQLEFLYRTSSEFPKALNKEHWSVMCEIPTLVELDDYVRSIYSQELNRDKVKALKSELYRVNRKRIGKNERRFKNGEMVYATNFNDLYSCSAKDLSRRITQSHGFKCCESERVGEPLPKLIIDCVELERQGLGTIGNVMRQIQEIYDGNMTSRYPFEIVIVNFVADNKVSDAMKGAWKFLYGPNVQKPAWENIDDIGDELSEEETARKEAISEPCINSAEVFSPHPFIPSLTSRDIHEVIGSGLGSKPIAYICQSTNKRLPREMAQYSGFAISLHDLHYSRRFINKSEHAYRLPGFQRAATKDAALSQVPLVNTLRNVYNGCEALDVEESEQIEDDYSPQLEIEKRYHWKQMLEAFDNTVKKSMQSEYNASHFVERRKSRRQHRYTREQRNQRRHAAEEQQSILS